MSTGVEDDVGCSAALQAVQLSGLVKGLATSSLRGYEHDDYVQSALAGLSRAS